MKKESDYLTALRMLAFFSLLLGIIYPGLISLIGQTFFNNKANGSLILRNNCVVGSELIGQSFKSEKYFSPRPSSINYNPFPSGASNFSVTDSRLKTAYESRLRAFRAMNKISIEPVYIPEMLFASASGVDPHISKLSALLQINRIASVRNLDQISRVKLIDLIDSLSQRSIMGLFGREYLNVLELNLKLDELKR